MKWIIDLVLVGIVVICIWRGYRNGIIRGVCGIIAIIVSLYGASIVANVYSNEFSGILEPFTTGIVDSSVSSVLNGGNNNEDNENAVVLTENEKSDVGAVSYAALRGVGLSEAAANKLSAEVAAECDTVNQEMFDTLSDKLCDRLAFVAVVGVSFILLAIIFSVIGNLINLSFEIPGLGRIESIAGAVLGLIKGLMIMYAIAMLARYLGLILPEETIESTWILSAILNSNPVANSLGL